MSKKVICWDVRGNKYKVIASNLVFRPSVYGVIIKNNKVLLSRQWDGYDFPGGGVELGETIEDALLREVREETGLKVDILKILRVENSFFKLPISGRFVQSILLYYHCKVVNGRVSIKNISSEEKSYVKMPSWIKIDDLDKVRFYNSADTKAIIQEVKNITLDPKHNSLMPSVNEMDPK